MIPEQRDRAAAAIRARMKDLDLTAAQLALKAGVDSSTVRALLHGNRWPNLGTRERINDALEWHPGEISRRASLDIEESLSAYTTADLLDEVRRRVVRCGI